MEERSGSKMLILLSLFEFAPGKLSVVKCEGLEQCFAVNSPGVEKNVMFDKALKAVLALCVLQPQKQGTNRLLLSPNANVLITATS